MVTTLNAFIFFLFLALRITGTTLPSNDEEERVGNEIYDDLTVEVELEGSSNDGESSLCSSNIDCPPELKWCVRRNYEGVGTCQSSGKQCPNDVEIQ